MQISIIQTTLFLLCMIAKKVLNDDFCKTVNLTKVEEEALLVPKKVTLAVHPYIMLLVKRPHGLSDGSSKSQIMDVYIGVANLIHVRWVITLASIVNPNQTYSVVGDMRNTIPADLTGVQEHTISEIHLNPAYGIEKGWQDIAVGKLSRDLSTPAAVLAWFDETNNRCPRHFETIYWVLDDAGKKFAKYQLGWFPKNYGGQCGMEYHCLMAKETVCSLCPCGQYTVSLGASLIIQTELHGMLLGYSKNATCTPPANETKPIVEHSHVGFKSENILWARSLINAQFKITAIQRRKPSIRSGIGGFNSSEPIKSRPGRKRTVKKINMCFLGAHHDQKRGHDALVLVLLVLCTHVYF